MKQIRNNVFPILAAMIWGSAFVAQSVGAEYFRSVIRTRVKLSSHSSCAMTTLVLIRYLH